MLDLRRNYPMNYYYYYYYIYLMAFFQHNPAGTKKVNHSRFYWNKSWWGGSGIYSQTICKSFAPRSRHV